MQNLESENICNEKILKKILRILNQLLMLSTLHQLQYKLVNRFWKFFIYDFGINLRVEISCDQKHGKHAQPHSFLFRAIVAKSVAAQMKMERKRKFQFFT